MDVIRVRVLEDSEAGSRKGLATFPQVTVPIIPVHSHVAGVVSTPLSVSEQTVSEENHYNCAG